MKFVLPLLLIFSALTINLFACPQPESGVPPCASWTRADAVFSGKVLKVESVPKEEGFSEGAKKIRFQVLENFKGVDNPTFAVVANPSTETGVVNVIKKGETWIIYARNDIVGKSFTEFRRVKIDTKTPNAELETLKNIIAGKTSSAITGQITSPAASAADKYEPVEITIEGGGKRFAAKSDADGRFNIPVTDGNYRVDLKFPYKASFKWDENLLGTSLTEGIPTVFKYNVRLNDGDCQFSFFEVI